MTKKELGTIGLPKWPQLVVVGETVTTAQAAEIIIRTDDLYWSTNDRLFALELDRVLYNQPFTLADPMRGYSLEYWLAMEAEGHTNNLIQYFQEAQNMRRDAENQLQSLTALEYLHNNRICSAYIGGPHGWCDWDGRIFTNSYNIGKWPHVVGILEEWQCIAKAFPFLKLNAQLFDREQCEVGGVPVVEYVVVNGKAKAVIPRAPLVPTKTQEQIDEEEGKEVFGLNRPNRERGCTITMFRQALSLTKRRVANKDSLNRR